MSGTDCIQNYYGKKETCLSEYHNIRKHMGDRTITREQYDILIRGAGLLYCWCPDDLACAMRSLLQELVTRQFTLNLSGKRKRLR